ncbi:hypothetical protein [Streptomyces sp. NPDC085540]|uniref:hypothetical protein n=1 Tax=Streptomyces sp. NPDC085540 TaxID=3365730 RepID=UPI0037CEB890
MREGAARERARDGVAVGACGGGSYVLAMMGSRTWLHAQWLSDTVAGALVGVGTCLVLWRAFAPLLETESERMASNSLWL